MGPENGLNRALPRKTAVTFVLLLGLVSLLADLTYEGARSISGPYLALLGASATAVGIVAGLGEFVGYGLRLVSGYVADRTSRYWAVTVLGYIVNLFAAPLLALASRWETAALLLVCERVGKGIRTPARDAMLSHATKHMGRGWGFAVHEALDQIGAVLGPLVVALVLALRGQYQFAFAILAVPALGAIGVLLLARKLYPRPRDLEVSPPEVQPAGLERTFWLYLAAVALVAVGYTDFPLIAYHFERAAILPASWVPLFYATAMGIDALAALLFGWLFDRLGLVMLVTAVLLSSLFAPLVFLGGAAVALLGTALWGVGMGAQESIVRAAIAEMVPSDRRGSAYGIFNAGYGLFWFVGSAIMGLLYDRSLPLLIGLSVGAQLAAVPVLVLVGRSLSSPSRRLVP